MELKHNLLKFLALGICFVGLGGGNTYANGSNSNSDAIPKAVVNLGNFSTTAVGKIMGKVISGRAMIVRDTKNGMTKAYVHVEGLAPNTTYATHVHDLPCDMGGGAHYKIDPTVFGTIEDNEIWPTVTTNGDGIGKGMDITMDHVARPEAQSIVIHTNPGGGLKIACADLLPEPSGATVNKGTFMTTEEGADLGLDISGFTQMTRSQGNTSVDALVYGLAADTTYAAHVHNLPCDMGGDNHYKISPFVIGTEEDNEIWPTVTTDGSGLGMGSDMVAEHSARPEAQSVVIHAGPDGGSPIACADLMGEAEEAVTEGDFRVLPAAANQGLDIAAISGHAKMIRRLRGDTFVFVRIEGLSDYTSYATHVHNLPCDLGGGSHYKIDPSVPGTEESNEIWPTVKTYFNGRGSGRAMVLDHVARPEAQSVVIHATPNGGPPIACADLD
jgi:hypothetical protein